MRGCGTHVRASVVLRSRGHDLSKDLVSLAGRDVAGMRLVHSIVNEYEVFRDCLLDVPDPVHGLDAERLSAMVLYKNMHVGSPRIDPGTTA